VFYNRSVGGLRSFAFAATLVVTLSSRGYQAPKLQIEEEKDSYAIYSTMLRIKEPRVANWAIVQQTVDFKLCLTPVPDQESVYRQMLDDYAEKNKNRFDLERKFSVPNYTLVERSEWTRSSETRSFAVFSAVGFNPSRTRAAVCLWGGSYGTCYALIKKDGAWQIDRDWRGGSCTWAA
jgi:hypothetical protein